VCLGQHVFSFFYDYKNVKFLKMPEFKPLTELIQRNSGISQENACLFHLEMWIYVPDMATMLATSYLDCFTARSAGRKV